MKQLVECVPNFSEGRNKEVIDAICNEIQKVPGVKLLNVDPGKATNRTVVTFAGEPKPVVEAAFLAIKKAAELIDMSQHQGEHPRMGATDVCPIIPIHGITIEEAVIYANQLAKRVGEELSIPVYLYEAAQPNLSRNNLSVIRAGEYEGFANKIQMPEWKPDYGPAVFNIKSGATVIGVRDFLIAYNVNLNTRSTRIANRIAFDVREAGRIIREGNPFTGKVKLDAEGNPLRQPGTLKHVKAIGWYIEEYGIAQLSMNLTHYIETPVHKVFEEVCKSADSRGVRVTGSELVGLIPLKALLDAGIYFLTKQGRSIGVSESELIHIAVKSLGLDELGPFEPEKRIIEYLLKDMQNEKLIHLSVKGFVHETASDSPAPGGGSVAALAGAMGIALGTMVANLSADKRGWEEQTPYFSEWAKRGQEKISSLLSLVDEDTRAFDAILESFKLPKDTEEEKKKRSEAIESASQYATQVPLETLKTAVTTLEILLEMAEKGNPNSLSDVGVGLACIQTAIIGARLNVLINAKELKDRIFADRCTEEANRIAAEAILQINNALQAIEIRLLT